MHRGRDFYFFSGSSSTGNTPKLSPKSCCSLSELLWSSVFLCFDPGFTINHTSQRGSDKSSNLKKLLQVISGLKTSVQVILSEMPFPAKAT